ncbi:hypothetical protein UFOVP22_59 [uncultured Caudovirales phage]|uniref:Uncharacterized protein n=1 Tax=uncultured Caudovirales phage TaxID=2100421 RepID=A0A6J5T8S9_9CAUD|nr:hypothetical protein UFOVP22_59 [uncultured Caudovirales phage]
MAIYRGPGGPGDATTDVSSQATLAVNAANAAIAAETQANLSAASALASATIATDKATIATDKATIATNEADVATAQAIIATTQAGISTTQATNSAASAASALAIYGNTTAMNNAVTAASTSASNSATSATNASNSATTATTQAGLANTSANTATSQATTATYQAGVSAAQATIASSQATIATTQAGIATTQASNAAISANNATTSANAASISASNANTSANSATTSATSATASALSATNSATSATTSATSATNSATSATSSATTSGNNATNATASATSASALASAASTSATNSANSAAQSAASAASAAAIVLGVSSNRASIRPSLLLDFANTRQLDPRITFARASTATYYDGKTTAMAEQNLLTYSEQFDNAIWTKSATTISADTIVAPDGNTTADNAISSIANSTHAILRTSNTIIVANNPLNTSIFVKPNGYNFVTLRLDDGGGTGLYAGFNVSTGVISTAVTAISTGWSSLSASITSVGNGWYRCSISGTPSVTTARVVIFIDNAISSGGASYIGDGTSGISLWGAQLEQRSAVTAYTPTTTVPITNYIPALQTAASGVARFDCNPTTSESLGLLIEEQRTNLLTYSDQFDNAAWTKTRSTITSNYAIAPDGTQTADALIEDSSNNSHFVNNGATVVNGALYTASIYAKANQRGYLSLVVIASTAASNTFFNLTNGTIVSTSANATSSITAVGNGWYRCSISVTVSSTGISVYPGISADGITSSYQGNGYSGIYIWGAQLEAGSFATSYIPTVASQVTRIADQASMTGNNFSSWYRQDEGSWYAEALSKGNLGNSPAIFGDTISYQGQIFMSTTTFGYYNGTNSISTNVTPSQITSNKVAISGTGLVRTICANGATVVSSNTPLLTTALNGLRIGSILAAGNNNINGTIKKISFYPKALTNTELQGLTS